MKRKQLVFVSIGILILVMMSWYVYQFQRISMKPVINDQPKYFLIGRGHVDTELQNLVKIKWTAIYSTHHPKCQYYKTPGAREADMPSSRDIIYSWIAKPNSKGNYQVRIPLDRYLPGECQWGIEGIYVKINAAPERWFVAIFRASAHNTKTTLSNTYACAYDKYRILHCRNTSGYKLFKTEVNPKKNYNIQLNVQSHNKHAS